MADFWIYYDNKPVAFIETFEKNETGDSLKRLSDYPRRIVEFENLFINGICKLPAEAMVSVSGSSTGTQIKYFYENKWYKQNKIGYEGSAEVLVSKVLSCSNLKEYVTYKKCCINGKKGCYSENFLKDNENYLSLQRLYYLYYNRELVDSVRVIEHVNDKIQYVISFVKESIGLDIREYLGKMFTLDMLILNTDRHFNNFGFISDKSANEYKMAPVFDNGNSLLSNIGEFPFEDSLEENIEKVIGQPFSANLEIQAMESGFGLKINYQKLYKILEKEPKSRALEVLKYQLKRYEKIIRDDDIEERK